MKVKELIAELEKVDPDMTVRVYADHGQVSIMADAVGVGHMWKSDADEWMVEDTIHDEDYEEMDAEEKEDIVDFFEIAAP